MRIRGFWSKYGFYLPGDVCIFEDTPYITMKPIQGRPPAENTPWVKYDPKRGYPGYTQEFETLPEFEGLEVMAASDIGRCTPVTIIDGKIDYASLSQLPVAGFTTAFVLAGRETVIATKGIIKADDWMRGGPLPTEYLEAGKIYYLNDRNGGLTLEPNDYPMFKALNYTEAEIWATN